MSATLPTTERLARALEKAGAPREMIDAARRERYDDFKSPSPTPIMDLVRTARMLGLREIARRAMDGEFDATREESEEWFRTEGRHLLGL